MIRRADSFRRRARYRLDCARGGGKVRSVELRERQCRGGGGGGDRRHR